MPAAAVIPAPIAYIKVVAVKKLVVGSRDAHSQASRVVGSNRRRVGVAGSVRWRTSVSTGPPVPSFWIPVPAIELVGTSQGAARRRSKTGVRSLGPRSFTVKKLECSKQADINHLPPNTLAWDNGIGPCPPIFSWFSRTRVMINRDSWGH